ncbi:MAG: N-acetyl-gamma-glutamyl-phosphate reductase [Pseudomonadota bacterium]
MIRVGIVGATGYGGAELVRLLVGHPGVELAVLTSRSEAGRAIDTIYPQLRGYCNAVLEDPEAADLTGCDVVFFATPNATAMAAAPKLLEAGVRVIDLAADFRLRDAAVWREWYGIEHGCPDLLHEAVYGLPEVNRAAIAGARLVANPGCYPTAVQLGLIPLLEAGAVATTGLVADAKSGTSGAGRKAAVGTLFAEVGENFQAYGAGGHRHLPEIEQGLAAAAGEAVELTFVPHLVPMVRGLHATLYARLREPLAEERLRTLFESRYADEPFVDVMPEGAHPQTRSVRGVNTCRLAVHRPVDGDTVVVLSAIDNLVKGAAGQAVQNMNIMCGFNEDEALMAPSATP